MKQINRWQKIGFAPRDGTLVLGKNIDGIERVTWFINGEWMRYYDDKDKPSFWTPIKFKYIFEQNYIVD